ncbi:MAG TPA: RluA family pseudouridine synthase [Geobacteraceae bacterium]
MITIKITATDHYRRVDSLLRRLLPAAPLSYLRKLVSSGHLLVNGARVTCEALMHCTDTVTLKESDRTIEFLSASPPSLDILFEDTWIIAFNKAPGLPMHPAAEVDGNNLVELGTELLQQRGDTARLRPVNRLDRGTSGVVLLARSGAAAGMFGRFVKEEGLEKLYLAVLPGALVPAAGEIVAPVDGKEALTRYRVLYQGEGMNLTAFLPVTGRMHQLRQHARLIGHPILGDRRYGGRSLPDYDGHALHSFRTALRHPANGERLIIRAPLPPQFLALLQKIAGPEASVLLSSLEELLQV